VVGQLAYWKAHPAEAEVLDTHGTTDPKGPTGVTVGDLVYFGAPPTHVAAVTGVDAEGHPTTFADAQGKTADSSDQEDRDPAKISTVVRPKA